jgi:hypothetical protein
MTVQMKISGFAGTLHMLLVFLVGERMLWEKDLNRCVRFFCSIHVFTHLDGMVHAI